MKKMDGHDKECYIKAGKIGSKVIAFARQNIKRGMLLIDIANMVEGKIKELGGGIAFPVNLSMNEIAAHYTPSSNDKSLAGGLLTVDLGVEIEGMIADCAFSLDLSENGEFKEMIELNEKVLGLAIKKVSETRRVCDIGDTIQEEIEKYNTKNKKSISVIKNLSGHSLDKNMIHAGLTISNCKNLNEDVLEDIAIAIEPFLTTGTGEVIEGQKGEIFMLVGDGQVRDTEARKILKFIKEKYETRPFCKRWLEKEGFKKIEFSLKNMENQGILHNFPVLIEKSKKPVSQTEHTVLFNGETITTTR